MSTVRRNKRGKQDERNGEGGWNLTDIKLMHSVSKSELVLWAKQATNDSDEMWTVLEATFMQAFLPHFRFRLCPEITCKAFFVALKVVHLQYITHWLGQICKARTCGYLF